MGNGELVMCGDGPRTKKMVLHHEQDGINPTQAILITKYCTIIKKSTLSNIIIEKPQKPWTLELKVRRRLKLMRPFLFRSSVNEF